MNGDGRDDVLIGARMNDAGAIPPAATDEPMPTFTEAFRVWLRIGLLSFGGPGGQIALLHREVVDERHWIGERRFLHALNFCTLLPGPEAQQLATYLGWLMHGVKGDALFFGLKCAVLPLVREALIAARETFAELRTEG